MKKLIFLAFFALLLSQQVDAGQCACSLQVTVKKDMSIAGNLVGNSNHIEHYSTGGSFPTDNSTLYIDLFPGDTIIVEIYCGGPQCYGYGAACFGEWYLMMDNDPNANYTDTIHPFISTTYSGKISVIPKVSWGCPLYQSAVISRTKQASPLSVEMTDYSDEISTVPETVQPQDYELYDLRGRIIKKGSVISINEINTIYLPSGVYIVNLLKKEGVLRKKIAVLK